MRLRSTSRIRRRFQRLSRIEGQVLHVLLTLSPLDALLHPVRLACLIHAASVHSEPGSNSPSRKVRPDDSGSTVQIQAADKKPRPRCRTRGRSPGSRTSHCAVPLPKSLSPPKRACRIIWHPTAGLQARKGKIHEKFSRGGRKGGRQRRGKEPICFSIFSILSIKS